MLGLTVSHYRVLQKIGSGGMGVVYEAEDLRLHRRRQAGDSPGGDGRSVGAPTENVLTATGGTVGTLAFIVAGAGARQGFPGNSAPHEFP